MMKYPTTVLVSKSGAVSTLCTYFIIYFFQAAHEVVNPMRSHFWYGGLGGQTDSLVSSVNGSS